MTATMKEAHILKNLITFGVVTSIPANSISPYGPYQVLS